MCCDILKYCLFATTLEVKQEFLSDVDWALEEQVHLSNIAQLNHIYI